MVDSDFRKLANLNHYMGIRGLEGLYHGILC